MNRSEQNPISDELLSAYIDGAVSNEERAIVEAAISADPALAWELESLRRTVALVQALPPLALPRSFALREDQVADVLAERRARALAPVAVRSPRQPVASPRRSFWTEFLAFFNSGNLLLRNATAVAAILFVVVLVTSPGANQLSNPTLTSAPSAMQFQSESPAQPANQTESVPAAAEPAAAEEAVPELPAEAEALAEEEEGLTSPASEMAQVAQLDASVSDAAAPMAKAASVPAAALPSDAAAMNAVPPGMDTGPSAAAMGAGPAGGGAPAARMMPGASGGALESGAVSLQAESADSAGNGTRSADGAIPANGTFAQPMNIEPGASPLAEPMAELALESASDAPEVAESPEAVAIQAAPADLSDASVAQESQASAASAEVDSAPIPVATGLLWSNWGWLQAAVGGLVLLLGALWLYTRRV